MTSIQPITLTAPRVQLLPLDPSHAAGLLEAAQGQGIWDYMPSAVNNEDAMVQWIETALAAQARGEELPFTIWDQQLAKIVGGTRYLDISISHKSLEIGWTWLSPEVHRTSVNTECKYLLFKHAFETLGVNRVQLKTDSRNERSQKAIERIGGVREGVLRRHRILPDGYVRDSVYFSVIAEEWPVVKARLEGMMGPLGAPPQ
ncbi:N-acetyltransferase [Capsulimonas corticalis]|uniref:N-acetyltransferase n=1 Tax=Capsulimonas corticalis TaxID=2219043 RepID=A0A402CV98_9BACT|nr:GNAT family protein [Capsulimonas corticalis]BDI30320.1 N-acetyltransferase [Capsulimonas corticalis]